MLFCQWLPWIYLTKFIMGIVNSVNSKSKLEKYFRGLFNFVLAPNTYIAKNHQSTYRSTAIARCDRSPRRVWPTRAKLPQHICCSAPSLLTCFVVGSDWTDLIRLWIDRFDFETLTLNPGTSLVYRIRSKQRWHYWNIPQKRAKTCALTSVAWVCVCVWWVLLNPPPPRRPRLAQRAKVNFSANKLLCLSRSARSHDERNCVRACVLVGSECGECC